MSGPYESTRPGILGVDFDGTINDGRGRWWAGDESGPNDDVIEAVNERYHEGWCVIVWTARPWSEANRVAALLTEWGVKYHGVRCEKGSADEYVDDKATPLEDFREEASG